MSKALNKATVCHITSVHSWNDIRIFRKECASLAKHTKKTTLVAPNAPTKTEKGVEVIGVPFSTSAGRIQRIFFQKKKVIRRAIQVDADIYHLHDPELLSCVRKLKRQGKKVIYDSHEDVPRAILSKPWIPTQLLRNLTSKLYNWWEKSHCKKSDGVISVLPEITKKFELPGVATETIYNYPMKWEEKRGKKNEKFTIIYNGGLTRIRGIKELCQAVNLVEDVQLQLLGTWESEAFQKECLQEIAASKMEYVGQVDFETCQNYLSRASVGVILFHKEPNHVYSLPNKAFEFVVQNLPMILSNIPFWKKEFKGYACYGDPKNPKEIATKIQHVRENYSEYLKKVKILQEEVLSDKNWQTQERKLVGFYNSIL